MDLQTNKKFEIFCGTGGVGKTTLATSRAIFLALQGKKVLLITIDPSQRLKDLLGLNNQRAGERETIFLENILGPSFPQLKAGTSLDGLLLAPQITFQRLIQQQKQNPAAEKANANRILQILSKPYGGMNEILALLELHHYHSLGLYDIIVLDTPPGKHFIEFLEGTKRIKLFFNPSFIEIFQFLGKKVEQLTGLDDLLDAADPSENYEKKRPKLGLIKGLVSSSIQKLLSYLERVTGKIFIHDFIETIEIMYRLKGPFLTALSLQDVLQQQRFSHWFLVTSAEHDKIVEAIDLQKKAQTFMHKDNFLAINKCLSPYWRQWGSLGQQEVLQQLRLSMMEREEKLKNHARAYFQNILEFAEILESSPSLHVRELTLQWQELSSGGQMRK